MPASRRIEGLADYDLLRFSEMASLLIVDGHSALFALAWLEGEHADHQRRARGMLVDWLARYQGATDESVVVVFDGRGRRSQTTEGGSEAEPLVMYSREGSSADAIIEKLAADQAPKGRVTVASNDRLVLDSAMASGADAISIRGLEEQVERALEEYRGRWDLR